MPRYTVVLRNPLTDSKVTMRDVEAASKPVAISEAKRLLGVRDWVSLSVGQTGE